MERSELARLAQGTTLWVEDTGERVTFRWLTLDGVRCGTAAGDRTYWCDEIVARQPEAKTARHDPLGKRKKKAPRRERAPKAQTVTVSQLRALETLSIPDVELWYHDIGATTAEALLARGWVREVGSVRCSRTGHCHPGALAITPEGLGALSDGTAACVA